jgi:integrase
MPKLTKRLIDSLAVPANKDRLRVTDSELTGFGVMVHASGRKSFFVRYGPRGQRRTVTLGQYGPLTPDAARNMAMELLGKVAGGVDPLAEQEAHDSMPTFNEWRDTYMVGVEGNKKHPRNDRRYLSMAAERWGNRRLDSLTVADVRKLFEAVTARGHRINANRWLASVRACLQAAWREDLLQANPAMKVRPNRENPPRDRVLSDDEFRRLLAEVQKIEDVHVRAGFTLLIETGARVSEVLHAQWSDLDLDTGVWRIPSTKAGRPQVLPLAPSTVAVLAGLEHDGPFVVAGRYHDRPRSDLKRPWAKLQTAAKLEDVHIHDIRRTFGLHIARRAGIHVASRLLRHSDIRVTERHYAPLGLEDLRKALDAREADVIPLRQIKES